MSRPVAAIDIGTNSIRLLIQKPTLQGWVNLLQRREIVRLGFGLDIEGNISEERIEKAGDVLFDYRHEVEKFATKKILAVGTEALRKARNKNRVREFLEKKLGEKIKIISGQEEAQLSYLGATQDWIEYKPWVLDIGGGSTELIGSDGEGVSFQFGALDLFQRYGEGKFSLMEKYLSSKLIDVLEKNWFGKIVGVGGTIANLAAMKKKLVSYQEEIVHGELIDWNWLVETIEFLKSLPISCRGEVKGLEKGREDIIIPGATILKIIMELTGEKQVTYSSKDILQGMIIKWAEKTK